MAAATSRGGGLWWQRADICAAIRVNALYICDLQNANFSN